MSDKDTFHDLITHGQNVDLTAIDWNGFGMRNSSTYRRQAEELFSTYNINKRDRYMIISLSTVMRKRSRVLTEIKGEKGKKLKISNDIINFIEKFCSDKLDKINSELFPFTHFPSCYPSVSCYAFCSIYKPTELKTIIENTWFCQLNVHADLKKEQKAWEKDVFTSQINGNFREEIWNLKSAEVHPLYKRDGTELTVVLNKKTLAEYIKTFI